MNNFTKNRKAKKRRNRLTKHHVKKNRRKAAGICRRKLGTLEWDYMEIAKRIAFELGEETKKIPIQKMDKLLSKYSGINIHEKLKFSKNSKKITNNFYSTDEWRELRIEAFNIHGYKCLKCGAHGEDVELHVDHIKPRSKYPELELDIDNMQILCKECNLKKSNYHSTDYREKTHSDYIEERLDVALLSTSPI